MSQDSDYAAVLERVMADARASMERRDAVLAAERGLDLDAFQGAREAERAAITDRAAERWREEHKLFRDADTAAAMSGRLRPTQALGHVDRWLETDVPTLILSGGVGVGKTVAALAASWRLRPARVVSTHDLARAIDPWRDDREDGWRPLDLALPFVAVDDLGMELDSERFVLAFGALIDRRQSPKRRTLITTNLDAAAIARRYGARVADRLRDGGKFVRVGGESLRGRRRAYDPETILP